MLKQIKDIKEFQEKIAEKQEGFMLKSSEEDYVKAAKLRNSLLYEEVEELEAALQQKDTVEILDAGVDILYIVLGTMHEAGVLDKFSKAWDLIHTNNMTKLGEDGKVQKNENGKVIKPDNYKPVDLKILF